jgi:hypothetical protein
MAWRNSILLVAMVAGCAGSISTTARAARPEDEPGRWAFMPPRDDFSPNALLDLRSLNEKVAGESGFIGINAEGDFTLGNGKQVRFWAVNTSVAREKQHRPRPLWSEAAPDLDRHARFLAKRGVNMVRLHAHLNPDLKANPNAKITDVNTAERDWIWRTVAAMKKQGIYTTVSPYWANTMELSEAWGVPGGAKQGTHALLFFDEKVQEGYRAWMRALLAEPNPYTGIPLARDPALGIIQIQNEDSLLFWTINALKGEQKTRLGRKFGDWLKRKYQTLDTAAKAWENDRLPGDDLAGGAVDFHNIWEMTQNRSGGRAKRLADQTQFWSETMHAFNRSMVEFFRKDLGCKQVVNAGNWKTADNVRLTDAERWSYTAGEVQAVNHYVSGLHEGPNRGWAIVKGDQFTSPTALLDPLELPINLKQVKGQPMMVTESSWVMPAQYQAEGPFLISAYQSLTGVDAFYWFATGDDEWTPPQSANGYLRSQQKWMFGSPDVLGTFPAAALMYRKGYIKVGTPVVEEERSLPDMWERRTPIISEGASYDPNRDAGSIAPKSAVKTGVSPYAFLTGPVRVKYDGDPSKSRTADLAKLVDPSGKKVTSVTGELSLDWGQGVCTVNAPQVQGGAGFFKNRKQVKLADVEITSGNDYGTVTVVSLDEKPLKSSRKVLVQVATQSRPTGWKETATKIQIKEGTFDGARVDEFGRAPWQVIRANVTVKIANPALKRARTLDANGNAAAEVTLTRTAAGVDLRFPEDTLYVVLE